MVNKKSLITYRENDLFKEEIPKIVRTLEGKGYISDIVKYEQGKDVNKEDINFNPKDYNLIFADDTVGKHFSSKDRYHNLDFVLEKTYNHVANLNGEEFGSNFGEKYSAGEETIGNFEKGLKYLINLMIQKNGLPKKVYVVSQKAHEHKPFSKENNPALVQKKVHKIFENVLGELGINFEDIEHVKGYESLENSEEEFGYYRKLSQKSSENPGWVFMDRHAKNERGTQIASEFTQNLEFFKNKVYTFPLGTLYNQLKNEKIIEISEEEFDRGLSKTLEELLK